MNTKLLIIDDEYTELLEKIAAGESPQDMEILTAPDGASGLQLLQDNEIHIVLFDIALPEMSGLDLCRRIRKQYAQRPLQIILLSGPSGDSDLRPILEAGGDDFIRKPVSGPELQMRLTAAATRMKTQFSLYQEREFYKQAVRQEEEMSARILDQNYLLKRAYQNMESMRRDLERSNQELEKIARYDSLSGLLNRASLFTMIEVEIDRATRSGLALSGIMIDVDNFKSINDTYGHQCGDAVIETIGRRLRERLRKYDIAGRYGGDELFIVLPDTPLVKAVKIAERFLSDLRTVHVSCEGRELLLSASMGVSEYRSGESRESWITRADHAMYSAKEQGRNTVVAE